MLALALLWAAPGCLWIPPFESIRSPVGADGPNVRLTVVGADNQDPLDGTDGYQIYVTGDDATVVPASLVDGVLTASLSEFVDRPLIVEALSGETVVSRSRTARSEAGVETVEASVFLARVGEFAWLPALETARWGGGLAADGDGRFYLAGGFKSLRAGVAQGVDSLERLDLSDPTLGLSFNPISTLPTYTDFEGREQTDRGGASFDPLDRNQFQRTFVLAGGSVQPGYVDASTATADLAIYEVESNDWSTIVGSNAMSEPRTGHATITSYGIIRFIGGWIGAPEGYFGTQPLVERFDGDAVVAGDRVDADVGLLDIHPVSLGQNGVSCGGAYLQAPDGVAKWLASDRCVVITFNGEVDENATQPALSVPVAGAAATYLSGNTTAYFGGVSVETAIEFSENTASAEDWIQTVDHGSGESFMTVGLSSPRAAAGAARLDDTHALVVGGELEYSPGPGTGTALSSAEIIDLESEESTPIGTTDDDASALPNRAASPMIAADPIYGILIVGGRDSAGDAVSGVALYMP